MVDLFDLRFDRLRGLQSASLSAAQRACLDLSAQLLGNAVATSYNSRSSIIHPIGSMHLEDMPLG
jgi:hypothetical protein